MANKSLKDFMVDDIRELCDPADELFEVDARLEAPQSPKYKIAQHVSWFTDRGGRVYLPHFVFVGHF